MSPIRDAALVRRVEPAEHVQQRALPDAGRADNRHHLAALERQVEPLSTVSRVPPTG